MEVCKILIFVASASLTRGMYSGLHTVVGHYTQTVFIRLGSMDCTGSIIHPLWVISSADCISFRKVVDYQAARVIAVTTTPALFLLGGVESLAMQYRTIVRTIYPNVTNVPGGRSMEIVLFKLNKPLNQTVTGVGVRYQDTWKTTRMAAGIFPKKGTTKTSCFVVGYGYATAIDVLPQPRTYRRIVFPNSRTCQDIMTAKYVEKYLCRRNRILTGLCSGDWGAPVVCNKLEYLVGIAKRPLYADGSCPHPRRCGRGDTVDIFTYSGDIWRIAKYYIPNLVDPVDIRIALGLRKVPRS